LSQLSLLQTLELSVFMMKDVLPPMPLLQSLKLHYLGVLNNGKFYDAKHNYPSLRHFSWLGTRNAAKPEIVHSIQLLLLVHHKQLTTIELNYGEQKDSKDEQEDIVQNLMPIIFVKEGGMPLLECLKLDGIGYATKDASVFKFLAETSLNSPRPMSQMHRLRELHVKDWYKDENAMIQWFKQIIACRIFPSALRLLCIDTKSSLFKREHQDWLKSCLPGLDILWNT